jgi:hypothetical protein
VIFDRLLFTLFVGMPGPFTVELTQFNSRLIGYYFIHFFIKGDRMLASIAFNGMGSNVINLPFGTRQYQIDGPHIQRKKGAVSLALSDEIHSTSCKLKKNSDTERRNIHDFKYIFLGGCIFWGKPDFP